ncbi:MAG: SPASM domain-containing protein [Candidatus Methanomethylicia archaeon]
MITQKKNNVGVILSSNFNIITDDMIDSLIKLKVDKIIVSLDGANQKSYSAYRKGGDFNRVINNIKKLLKRKHELNSKKPTIIWQYLINNKNIKLVKKAKKTAKKLGIKIRFEKFQISQEIVRRGQIIDKNIVNEWVPKYLRKDPKNYLFVTKKPCKSLWKTLVINSDGSVSPCCAIYDSKNDFDNILKNSLKKIWNNSNFLSARSIFSNKKYYSKKKTICHSCSSANELKEIKIK